MKNKLYNVFNVTDGFFANAEPMSKKDAMIFKRRFPLRYKLQGYYRNSRMEKMKPEDVQLEIIEDGASIEHLLKKSEHTDIIDI